MYRSQISIQHGNYDNILTSSKGYLKGTLNDIKYNGRNMLVLHFGSDKYLNQLTFL